MGGPIIYSCSAEAKDTIPRLLQAQGIKVNARPLPKEFTPDEGFKFVCSRGAQRIRISGVYVPEEKRFVCGMDIDHSLFCFWRQTKDFELLEKTESILQGSGTIWRYSFAESNAHQDKTMKTKAK